MSRGKRDLDPGVFHVWTHSVWTSVLFKDDVDRMCLLTELAAVVARFGWTCIGFCLLSTHYHLIVETFDRSLGDGMKRLNLALACSFNARHQLRGHVVGDRYSSRRIETESDLLTVHRYVMRNALVAGLCEALEQWPWCSYRSLVEPVDPFPFVDISKVAGCFRPDETATEQLRRFIDSPW